jgi:HSP20 family protein
MPTGTLATRNFNAPVLFEDFFKPWNEWFDNSGLSMGRMITVPAVNINEDDIEFVVSLAAPGMNKNDFKIDLDGNILSISSEKEENKEEKEKKFTRKEYSYTSFNRSFTLPAEVNKEKIEARYEDGVLRLILPKNEEAKKKIMSKQITVK